MAEVFSEASMVLVHAEHSLGLKLKLIQACYQARWIIAHEAAVAGLDWTKEMSILTYHDAESLQDAVQTALSIGWDATRSEKTRQARSPWTEPVSVGELLS